MIYWRQIERYIIVEAPQTNRQVLVDCIPVSGTQDCGFARYRIPMAE